MTNGQIRYENVGLFRVRIWVTTICGVVSLSVAVFAAEQKGHGVPCDEIPISSPGDWHEIVAPADSDSLSMLADQMRGNFEKLRTWQGIYSVRLRGKRPS